MGQGAECLGKGSRDWKPVAAHLICRRKARPSVLEVGWKMDGLLILGGSVEYLRTCK